MVQTITKKNANKVLCSAFKKLESAYSELSNPGCDCDAVGEMRCEATNAIRESMEKVRELIHQTYML